MKTSASPVFLVAVAALLLPPTVVSTSARAADDEGFRGVAVPFLKKHCTSCHSGDKPKGDFAIGIKTLPNDFLDLTARGRWKEIVNVLNSHEMPPKDSPQPTPAEVAAIVDWITRQAVDAELARRETSVVLRRLNRDEYRNAIRDLIGVEFDVSGFPQDPSAGGFDNIGAALTVSPLHLETYLNAARQILDRALVEGERPAPIKWRFQPRVAPIDTVRVRLDPKNNAIVNGAANVQDGDWVMIHHDSWNKHVGARDFRVPHPGTYAIRVTTAARIPKRDEVTATAAAILAKRRDDQTQKDPSRKKWHDEQYERDLEHFRTDRMYDYGPPRVRLILQLGPQPKTLAEFDAAGTKDKPTVHEFQTRFTTESAGVSFEYAYAIPKVLENFWLQTGDSFARPELLIREFEIEGPLYDAWPPASHRRLLVDSPLRDTDESAYANLVLRTFMRKAFRRPVSDEEVAAKRRHYDDARGEGASFVEAIKRPLVSILTSPHFLYVAEPAGGADVAENAASPAKPRPLDDHQLAARLSLFLWSSVPDDELRELADAGNLSDPDERLRQVDRLLKDERSQAFVKNFCGQWLSLREVGTNPPAADLYPQYDRHLETSIVRESEEFFREILQHDLNALALVKSDFLVINERLARFYGVDGVRGDNFRRVPTPDGVERGGVPTQASILTITSNGTRTSPVKRGTWILKTLLGIDPGLPVANAGEIAPKVPGVDKATVRKRLEIHRSLPQCARCHDKIDPLGFALENYNAAGEWRLQEGFGYKGRIEKNDPVIDATSEMIDGTKIVGVAGLQSELLRQEDLFLSCLASKVLTYAIGRELGLADQPTIKAAVAHMKQHDRTIRSLLKFTVTSEAFSTK